MKIVIRAGGIGSRLWPLSRKDNPKQFQSIVGDKTMLRTTYERVSDLLESPEDLFVSVNEKFVKNVKKEVPELLNSGFIVETDVRNTGPAMCLEVCYLELMCDDNEIIASLPSDDYISDSDAFCTLLKTTEEFIRDNPSYILTPAVIPGYVDTGYSYMRAGESLQNIGDEKIYSVAEVEEKPNVEYCKELIESGIHFCHTGIYLWQLKHIISLFKKHQKEMYDTCKKIAKLMVSGGDIEEMRELYSKMEKISIESAITERVDKIAMSVSNRIGWSDLGKWHVIKKVLKDGDENLLSGNIVEHKSTNNLVYSMGKNKKIVVINDVDNLVIVDTDDALYISSLENSAEIKNVMEDIKKEGFENYL